MPAQNNAPAAPKNSRVVPNQLGTLAVRWASARLGLPGKNQAMQVIRHVLFVAFLAVAPAVSSAQSAASAPAPAAKSPPRAPTLVSVTPGAPGPAPAATQSANAPQNFGASASAIVDPIRMVGQIQAAPLAQREALIREIDSRMDAAQRALVALRDRMSLVGQRNGNAFVFQRAFVQARTCDQTLRKSLQVARETKTAASWATAQAALVRDYGDYARSVVDADAAGRSPAIRSP
jgi:hypothetical protein